MGRAKTYSRSELVELRQEWKNRGRRVVFTNGCFDLLHRGHLHVLEQARALGDVLVVGVNSDRSVRALKGPGRPVQPGAERAELLAALECVEAVTVFDEDTPAELVAVLLPDVLVKGSDWGDYIVGREQVAAAGGEVVSIPIVEAPSTTELISRIRNLP